MLRIPWRAELACWSSGSSSPAFIAVGSAQWGWGVGEGNLPAPLSPPQSMPDRSFTFCKLMYDQVRYEALGMGWSTDYPFAGINLMYRLEDLTAIEISTDGRGEPNHWVVRLTDDELFNCPFVMAADVGTIGLSGEEAARSAGLPAQGGLPLGGRLLGPARLGSLGERDQPCAPPVAIPDP